MGMLQLVASILTSQLLPFTYAVTPCALTVETKNGPIQGHLAENRSEVTEFLGIPFAQPPVGDLRFAAPKAYGGHGLLVAKEFVSSIAPTFKFFHSLLIVQGLTESTGIVGQSFLLLYFLPLTMLLATVHKNLGRHLT